MAFLQVLSGDLSGQRIVIGAEEVVIGRSSASTLQVDDPSVSGRHCRISRQGATFVLRDLGSTNGTSINGVPIEERRLHRGDVFSAGSVKIMIDGDDVEAAAPEAPSAESPAEALGVGVAAGPSPFGKRRDTKWMWYLVISLVLLGVVGALYWFLSALFK
jgi:predicted component of type VI protein secretion system